MKEFWPVFLREIAYHNFENKVWATAVLIFFLSYTMLILRAKASSVTTKGKLSLSLFITYMFLLLTSTLFTRETSVRNYNLVPFWSYVSIWKYSSMTLLAENLLNIIMFMPVGFLLPGAMGVSAADLVGRKHKWILWITYFGLGLSVMIEFMQLIFCKGLFEFDDMIHNTLGAILGYLLWRLLMAFIYRVRNPKG